MATPFLETCLIILEIIRQLAKWATPCWRTYKTDLYIVAERIYVEWNESQLQGRVNFEQRNKN